MESKLKEYRLKNNLTQVELAEKTKTTPRYIAFLESGDRTPSLPIAMRIAKVLGEHIDNIFLP